MANEEENVEEQETVEENVVEEAAPEGAEFVPDILQKPKSDVYTALIVVTFVAFFVGTILAGRELWEHYDVQFWVFGK